MIPLDGDGTAARSARASLDAWQTTRGKPNSGNGGSSGWIAILKGIFSATGMISRRKAERLARSPVFGKLVINVQHAV